MWFGWNGLSAAVGYEKAKMRGGSKMKLAVPGPVNVCSAYILGIRSR